MGIKYISPNSLLQSLLSLSIDQEQKKRSARRRLHEML